MAASYRSSLWATTLLLAATGLQAKEIQLVTGEDYPPFAGSELADGGSLARLVQAAFQEAGLASKIAFKPWSRGYEDTLSLDFDATFPYLKTPEREADYLFSEPLQTIQSRFFVLHHSIWQTGERDELRDALICLPTGYAVRGWVSRESHQTTLIRPRSMTQCHEMLVRGRVDALISNPDGVAFQLYKQGLDNSLLRPLPHTLSDASLHLIIPHRHPQSRELMMQFNQGLGQLRDTGRLQQIIAEPVRLSSDQTP